MGRRVLITQQFLTGWSGSETATRDLAIGLMQQGCSPVVYTQAAGVSAAALREASIPVVEDLDLIGEPPALIHAHHHPVMATAIARFPDTPVVAVHQDFVHWLDTPQRFPSIRRWVAVDQALFDRLVLEGGVPEGRVKLLLNAIDVARFGSGPPLPETPRRALGFAKNNQHVESITEACRQAGIALDWIGTAVGRVSDQVETLLPEYDLVFASALSALEAMASGRAVVVCDGRGMAGFCTAERWAAWRPHNFGLRVLRQPVTTATVLREIALYDAAEAGAASELTRSGAAVTDRIARIIALHDEVLAEPVVVDHQATLHAFATYLRDWSPRMDHRWPWLMERQALLEARASAEAGLDRMVEGVSVALGEARNLRSASLVSGFHAPEPWGVWAGEGPAVLSVRLPAGSRFDLGLTVRSIAAIAEAPVRVAVGVNGTVRTVWTFEPGQDWEVRTLAVPPELVPEDGRIWITLAPSLAIAPASRGLGADQRPLSLALSAIVAGEPSAIN